MDLVLDEAAQLVDLGRRIEVVPGMGGHVLVQGAAGSVVGIIDYRGKIEMHILRDFDRISYAPLQSIDNDSNKGTRLDRFKQQW